MTAPFPPETPIRDDRSGSSELAVCPACGGGFASACAHCRLKPAAANAPVRWVRLSLAGAPLDPQAAVLVEAAAPLDLDPAGHQVAESGPVDALASVAVLEAAQDPMAVFIRWRKTLKNNGVLLVVLARPETGAVWEISRPALMRMAERAGFRMIRHKRFSRQWWFRRY